MIMRRENTGQLPIDQRFQPIANPSNHLVNGMQEGDAYATHTMQIEGLSHGWQMQDGTIERLSNDLHSSDCLGDDLTVPYLVSLEQVAFLPTGLQSWVILMPRLQGPAFMMTPNGFMLKGHTQQHILKLIYDLYGAKDVGQIYFW